MGIGVTHTPLFIKIMGIQKINDKGMVKRKYKITYLIDVWGGEVGFSFIFHFK
jgi:hypothetical protein